MFIVGLALGAIIGFIVGEKLGSEIEAEDAIRRHDRECVYCQQRHKQQS